MWVPLGTHRVGQRAGPIAHHGDLAMEDSDYDAHATESHLYAWGMQTLTNGHSLGGIVEQIPGNTQRVQRESSRRNDIAHRMCASAVLRSRNMLLDRRITFETPVLHTRSLDG